MLALLKHFISHWELKALRTAWIPVELFVFSDPNTRAVSRTEYTPLTGSAQICVPVYPTWVNVAADMLPQDWDHW